MVIDILMLLIMLAMAGIGLLIKYTLIPGSMRYQVYNENVELYRSIGLSLLLLTIVHSFWPVFLLPS